RRMRFVSIAILCAACGFGHDEHSQGLPGGSGEPDGGAATPDGNGTDPTAVSPLVNVLRVGGAELPISGGIAVRWAGGTLTTFDPGAAVRLGDRALAAGPTSVLGTGDLDGDGLADVALIDTAPAASPCAAGALDRTLTVVSGAHPGNVLYQGTLPDACISING